VAAHGKRPAYHGTSQATGGNRWQRIWLVFAASAPGRFATDRQRLHPRGSIKAPSSVVNAGDTTSRAPYSRSPRSIVHRRAGDAGDCVVDLHCDRAAPGKGARSQSRCAIRRASSCESFRVWAAGELQADSVRLILPAALADRVGPRTRARAETKLTHPTGTSGTDSRLSQRERKWSQAVSPLRWTPAALAIVTQLRPLQAAQGSEEQARADSRSPPAR
jgi:hypothetical protein